MTDQFEPLLLLRDEPVRGFGEDDLSMIRFSRVVAGAAVGTEGPFTVGVFADWGEGKTSVLRQAKNLVDTQHGDEIVTAWFNAWQYEKEDHPIVPLVATIVRQIDRKLDDWKSRGEKVKDAVVSSFSSVGRALRAVAYGFSAKAKGTVPGFAELEAGLVAKEMVERYESLRKREHPLLEQTLYYNAFEALESASGLDKGEKPEHRIVVFIDDLDRCLPPQAMKLLESIKLVLAQPGFIFVLAVDRRMIEGYLSLRYEREYGVADYGTSGTAYLDKIIQLPFPLPSHRSRFEHYIRRLMDGPVLKHDSNGPVRAAIEGLVDVLAAGSNYNPRNLVRFINTLIVDHRIWTEMGEKADAKRLGVCAVSRILRKHLGDANYRQLMRDQKLCDCIAKGTFEEEIQQRGVLEPSAREEMLGLSERATRDIYRVLRESEFLRELFATEPGKQWLTDTHERRAVNEFLVEQREEVEEGELSQAQIVEAAIRTALGKPEGAPITDSDRAEVEELSLAHTRITDAGLAHLKTLSWLQTLYLAGTGITDVGLAHLEGLTSLRWLDLSATAITNVGLAHLKTLSLLQTLGLTATPITDAGLVHLLELSSLRLLSLANTKVTDAGVEELQKALPKCEILW